MAFIWKQTTDVLVGHIVALLMAVESGHFRNFIARYWKHGNTNFLKGIQHSLLYPKGEEHFCLKRFLQRIVLKSWILIEIKCSFLYRYQFLVLKGNKTKYNVRKGFDAHVFQHPHFIGWNKTALRGGFWLRVKGLTRYQAKTGNQVLNLIPFHLPLHQIDLHDLPLRL